MEPIVVITFGVPAFQEGFTGILFGGNTRLQLVAVSNGVA